MLCNRGVGITVVDFCRPCGFLDMFPCIFLTELRSWWEVPSIAHFCSLFAAAFDLTEFHIDVSRPTL